MRTGAFTGESEKCQLILDHFPDPIMLIDADGYVQYASPASRDLLGFTAETFEAYVNHVASDDGEPVRKAYFSALSDKEQRMVNFRIRTDDGSWRVIELRVVPVLDEMGGVEQVLLFMRDFTNFKKKEQELLEMALTDPLTALPNRRAYVHRIEQVLEKAKRSGERVAVVSIDCDNLKGVNDNYGHRVGDLYLQVVAQKIKASIRDTDMLFRWGGDEFVLILVDVQSKARVRQIVDRIVQVLAQERILEGCKLNTPASIGIAMFPEDGLDEETLFRNANQAMHQVKRGCGSQYCFHNY